MQKLVFMLLLAGITSLALVPLVYGINTSNDENKYDPTVPGHKKLSPKSFGNKDRENEVCGDKLCDSIGISDTLKVILSSNT